jgi:ABC-type nitrate/sulfonate/bicarbonate transport system substrate-binding protein
MSSAEADSARIKLRLASGAGGIFGVDDIAVAHASSGGFWEREGLDVEWVGVRGCVRAAEVVLTGQVDAGYGTWVPCVSNRVDGKPNKILVSMAQALAQNLIIDRNRIASTADLRGKRWAVDGLGALSHTLAHLIVQGLGIPDGEVEWIVAGPPPQRIEQLLNGTADCSLVRVEEAAVLARKHPEKLSKLLGFEEILPLAPVQPHGILSVTDDFAKKQPDVCKKLVRGLVLASRGLHDSLDAFRQAVRHHVTERPETLGPRVDVSDEEIDIIWQREVAAGSFAVNGGLSCSHWAAGLHMYVSLHNGAGTKLTMNEMALPQLVADALTSLGEPHPASHDTPDKDGGSWDQPLVELGPAKRARIAAGEPAS